MKTLGKQTVLTILAAFLSSVAVAAACYMPEAGVFLLVLAGLPALLLMMALGINWFLLYGLLLVASATVVESLGSGLLLVPLLLLPAALLSFSVKRGASPFRAIGITVLTASMVSSLLWVVAPSFGPEGRDLWSISDQVRNRGEMMRAKLIKAHQEQQSDAANIRVIIDEFDSWVEFMILLVPVTFIFCWHLASILFFYAIAAMSAERMNFRLEPLPSLSTWQLNWNLIWVFFAGWLLYYGADQLTIPTLVDLTRRIGANCLAISKMLYFISGFSILYFYLETYKVRPINKVGISVLAFMLSQLMVWLGIIDVWADFRALQSTGRPKVNPGSGDNFINL